MMYTIVTFSGFDAVLERITVGFFDKFSSLDDFFRTLQRGPPFKSRKNATRGVSVAKAWDTQSQQTDM